MGGCDYSRTVYSGGSSSSFSSGGASSCDSTRAMYGKKKMEKVSAQKKVSSIRKSPIVLCLDVTGSNTEFAKIAYDKMPMLFGQIQQQNYLEDFDILITAVGDAYSDQYPLQVTDFAYGKDIDKKITSIFLEGNGGGQKSESYELAAWYFANMCEMPEAELPFLFILADERPYLHVDKKHIETHIGQIVPENIHSKNVFDDLNNAFKGNVYVLLNKYCNNDMSTTNKEIKPVWESFLEKEKIITINDPKSIIDIILGIIAMRSNSRDIDAYIRDMQQRGQTRERIKSVRDSIEMTKDIVVAKNLPANTKKEDDGGELF